ncbi:MAG: FMN-binding protein [Planctomycetota bacterium]
MTENALPIVERGAVRQPHSRRRNLAMHGFRVCTFLAILGIVRLQGLEQRRSPSPLANTAATLAATQQVVPSAASIEASSGDSLNVFDASGKVIARAMQTSPVGDSFVGFSGPTNMLVITDSESILGVLVLSSLDTQEHVDQIERDSEFLPSFSGVAAGEPNALLAIDAVSGATLTSRAIQSAVVKRLTGKSTSLMFSDPDAERFRSKWFPDSPLSRPSGQTRAAWIISDDSGNVLGHLLNSSPAADSIVGYQGPSELWIAFDGEQLSADSKLIGLAIDRSYDNDPYVGYVREDSYFPTLFEGLTLAELAELDPFKAQVEGVSGATMTSLSATDALIATAKATIVALESTQTINERRWLTWGGTVTLSFLGFGIVIASSRLRGKRWLRLLYQIGLIALVGLTNGDMLSQAVIAGWSRNEIPWLSAFPLVMLCLAAVTFPMFSKQNVYCSHLCPHGAVQQLVRSRLPWQWKLPKWLITGLKLLPPVLLAWCVLVAVSGMAFSLVDIEPFDAWIFRLAGWPTIVVALVGLGFSLFSPMAYCRFGCPTGAMLGFLRFRGDSGNWTIRDTVAVALLLVAALTAWLY